MTEVSFLGELSLYWQTALQTKFVAENSLCRKT